MRTYLFAAVIIFVFLQGAAGYTLEGTVFGLDEKPLEDVQIKVLDAQRRELAKDYSNRNGEFSMHGLPGGTFLLEADKFGLNTYSTYVTLAGISSQTTVYQDIHFSEVVFRPTMKKDDLTGIYLPKSAEIEKKAYNHYRKGLKLLEKGNIEKALKKFEKASESDPSFARALTEQGHVHKILKDFNTAKEYLLKAIPLNVRDPQPHIFLGDIYLQEKSYENAVLHLEKAVELDNGLVESYLLLGEAYYRLSEWVKAEYAFTQGLLIQPRHAGVARIYLGNVYMKLNRLTDARDQYAAYLRENPYSEQAPEIKQRIRELDRKISLYKLPDME